MRDTLSRKVYRLLDLLPWLILYWYSAVVEPNTWLAATALSAVLRRLLVGWEYTRKINSMKGD